MEQLAIPCVEHKCVPLLAACGPLPAHPPLVDVRHANFRRRCAVRVLELEVRMGHGAHRDTIQRYVPHFPRAVMLIAVVQAIINDVELRGKGE